MCLIKLIKGNYFPVRLSTIQTRVSSLKLLTNRIHNIKTNKAFNNHRKTFNFNPNLMHYIYVKLKLFYFSSNYFYSVSKQTKIILLLTRVFRMFSQKIIHITLSSV